MEDLVIDKFNNDKKGKALIKGIKEACNILYLKNGIDLKTKKAREAIKTNDREIMVSVLLQYLKKYKGFINSLTVFTNIEVRSVPIDFYKNCSIENIREQLETVIGFIYLKEALESKIKDNFKNLLKKQLQKTGLFSENELSIL